MRFITPQFVVFVADCCYGEQRAQLRAESGGAGEDGAEVRPTPGAAAGGLDSGAVWGRSGEAATGERQLPKVANGRHGEWVACAQNRKIFNYLKKTGLLSNYLKKTGPLSQI